MTGATDPDHGRTYKWHNERPYGLSAFEGLSSSQASSLDARDAFTRQWTGRERDAVSTDLAHGTRDAWLRLRIREQDREPGAILGARPRGQPRTTTDVHGEHVCGSERQGRLAGPVRTLGRGLQICECVVTAVLGGLPPGLGPVVSGDSLRIWPRKRAPFI